MQLARGFDEPEPDKHRYSFVNQDMNGFDTDYSTSSTNYKNDFMSSHSVNSRQIYGNGLQKQPKSHTDINCYQDINMAGYYSSGDKIRHRRHNRESKSISHDQYAPM
jgi:hypothetical protein